MESVEISTVAADQFDRQGSSITITSTMLLLSHYPFILVTILCEWIDAFDLCYLDTAVCNYELRNYLKNAMNKCRLVHINFYKLNAESMYKWIELRGMGLRAFNFGTQAVKVDYQLSCLSRLKKVAHLIVDETLSSQLHPYRDLEVASLRLSLPYGKVRHFLLKFGFALRKLWLHNNITSKAHFSVIADCCPSLRSLSVAEDAKVLPVMVKCDIHDLTGSNIAYLCGHKKRFRKSFTEVHPLISIRCSTLKDSSTLCIAGKTYFWIEVQAFDFDLNESLSKLALQCAHQFECFKVYYVCNPHRLLPLLCSSNTLRELGVLQYHNWTSLLQTMSENCPNIESIECNSIVWISADTILRLFQGCPKLTRCKVRSSTVSPALIHELLKRVESFHLSHSRDTTSIHFDVDKRMSRLFVVVEYPVTLSTIVSMIGEQSELKKVSLDSLAYIGHKTEPTIHQLCPKLKIFEQTQCINIESTDTEIVQCD